MSKRSIKITLRTVLTPGEARQGMLFADAFTDTQQRVLELADGTRTVLSIIRVLKEPKNKIVRIVREFLHDGYLVVAEPADVLAVCEKVIAEGRLEDAIGLYRFVQQYDQTDFTVVSGLAELYVRSARAREASLLYSQMAAEYAGESRFGEALVAQRRAAGLQPGNYKVQADLSELCIITGRAEEAARVWRVYAMRLAGVGEYQQALDIIDNAVSRIGGNDTLFYAEAEILALMDGKPLDNSILNPQSVETVEPVATEVPASAGDSEYRDNSEYGEVSELDFEGDTGEESPKMIEPEVAEYRSVDRYRTGGKQRSGSRLFGFMLALVGLLVLLTVANYYYRSRMYSAVLKSRGIGSLVQSAGLTGQIAIAEDALKVLEDNRPPLAFMQSSEYRNQLARVRQLVADKSGELLRNNIAFDRLLDEWKLKHTPSLASRIDSFRTGGIINRQRVELAEEVHQTWQREQQQKLQEREDSIRILADKSRKPEARFAAYRDLLLNFSEVFTSDYPNGARNLTVPAQIHAEIAGSGREVALKLQGAKLDKEGFWEIPVDPESHVYIVHPGYYLSGEEEGTLKTRMPYPLTFEQFFVLHKAPVVSMAFGLDFTPEKGLVFANAGRVLLSSREEYALADLNSGRVGGVKQYLRDKSRHPLSAGLMLTGFEEWVGVLNDGVFYLGEGGNTEDFELNPLSEAGIRDVLYATLIDLELGRYDGAGAILTSKGVKTDSAQPPVGIVEAGTGRNVWKQTGLIQDLFGKLKTPVVYMAQVAWDYLLVEEDGSVFLVRENGDVVLESSVELAAGERLTAENVRFCKNPEGDYLFISKRVFLLSTSPEPVLSELWQTPGGSEQVIPADSGIIGYDERELRLYSLGNGETLFTHQFTGRLVQKPVVVGDVIYLVEQRADSESVELVALDTRMRDKPKLWTYPLRSGVRLLFGGDGMVGVLSADGRFLGFVR